MNAQHKPAAMTLAEHLKTVRLALDPPQSIRQVAETTKISNAYLSQLERGVAGNPSPHVLHTLAKHYNASYETLMILAGYLTPPSEAGDKRPSSLEVLLKDVNLTHREQEEVKKFILGYLRGKK